MASTRDLNSKQNYCLEQKALKQIRDNLLFINGPGGHGYNPAFPALYDNGKMPSSVLSCNPTDIESALFGIEANNLVNPRGNVEAKLKKLDKISFFERPEVIISNEVKPDKTQRPFIF